MDEHIYKSHNKTLLLYHLVFPSKYRKKIFDDKIEFTNHGTLPSVLTIDDMKNGRYKSMPRNLQIADIFKAINII